MTLTACGESSPPLPAAPSPLPTSKIPILGLACAPDVRVRSLDAAPVRVSYGPPTVTGGLAPVTASCSPSSPLTLAVGTHSVLCRASDSFEQGQTASCSVSLTVLPPLELSAMRFLAFGDSITAGTTSSPLLAAGPPHSYPPKLVTELSRRYVIQSFEIENAGIPGEQAANAVSRFRSELLRVRPEVVLLMEGTNDLGDNLSQAPTTALAALGAMILEAKTQGVTVMLASLPPQRAAGRRAAVAAFIPSFNVSLEALAQQHVIPFIDVFTPLSQAVCGPSVGPLTCIGQDHLHPTEEGYTVMARAFADAIERELDISQQFRVAAATASLTGPASHGQTTSPQPGQAQLRQQRPGRFDR